MPRHEEKRDLPYTAVQMFDLVADIESYPLFLPWCAAARITGREGTGARTVVHADLRISFKVFQETFASTVALDKDAMRIDVSYREGPFKHMVTHWVFVDNEAGGCCVDFFVDFEFRSRLLERMIGVLFHQAMQRIIHAFEMRARSLYSND